MGDEILEGGHVGRYAFQDEIDFARQHPALAHQRLGADELLEGAQIGLRLAGEVHCGEHRDVEAELSRERYAELSLHRGDRVFVRPRRARVFVPDEETQTTPPDLEWVL